MGGALRALGSDINGIYLNPANMGIQRVYHIAAVGQWTPEAARQLYGGAIVDSTRRLAGGLSVIGGFQDPDGIDRSHIDVRIAFAFAAVLVGVYVGGGPTVSPASYVVIVPALLSFCLLGKRWGIFWAARQTHLKIYPCSRQMSF